MMFPPFFSQPDQNASVLPFRSFHRNSGVPFFGHFPVRSRKFYGKGERMSPSVCNRQIPSGLALTSFKKEGFPSF